MGMVIPWGIPAFAKNEEEAGDWLSREAKKLKSFWGELV